jgi:light-regulated signal transduction histidine kinase (bacteriophytochrome)
MGITAGLNLYFIGKNIVLEKVEEVLGEKNLKWAFKLITQETSEGKKYCVIWPKIRDLSEGEIHRYFNEIIPELEKKNLIARPSFFTMDVHAAEDHNDSIQLAKEVTI